MNPTPEAELILAAAQKLRELPFTSTKEAPPAPDEDGDICVHCLVGGNRVTWVEVYRENKAISRFWIVAALRKPGERSRKGYQNQLSGARNHGAQVLFIPASNRDVRWRDAVSFPLLGEASLDAMAAWAVRQYQQEQIPAAE